MQTSSSMFYSCNPQQASCLFLFYRGWSNNVEVWWITLFYTVQHKPSCRTKSETVHIPSALGLALFKQHSEREMFFSSSDRTRPAHATKVYLKQLKAKIFLWFAEEFVQFSTHWNNSPHGHKTFNSSFVSSANRVHSLKLIASSIYSSQLVRCSVLAAS